MTDFTAENTQELNDEQLELVAGGFDPTAPDPNNPLCPPPRGPHPWLGARNG